jgi:hypothetical protein
MWIVIVSGDQPTTSCGDGGSWMWIVILVDEEAAGRYALDPPFEVALFADPCADRQG